MMSARVHPVVMYPFRQPDDFRGLIALYEFLDRLDRNTYQRPITIVDNQTICRTGRNVADKSAVPRIVREVSTDANVKCVWAVDTCQMWLHGLGEAFEAAQKAGVDHDDVFWLIPGDFDYASVTGAAALHRLPHVPEEVLGGAHFCIGEIKVPADSSKQLIDTLGTIVLLEHWFPAEAELIQRITVKPRSEFFAINYPTLERILIDHRWYAYEQTLIILLHILKTEGPNYIRKVDLGEIKDDAAARMLAGAIMQIERMERALKLYWRETHHDDWQKDFPRLNAQSDEIRRNALEKLQHLLMNEPVLA